MNWGSEVNVAPKSYKNIDIHSLFWLKKISHNEPQLGEGDSGKFENRLLTVPNDVHHLFTQMIYSWLANCMNAESIRVAFQQFFIGQDGMPS